MLFVSLIHIYGTLIVYRITMGVRLRNVLKNVVLLEVDEVISRLFILLFNEMKMFFFLNENYSMYYKANENAILLQLFILNYQIIWSIERESICWILILLDGHVLFMTL